MRMSQPFIRMDRDRKKLEEQKGGVREEVKRGIEGREGERRRRQ